MINEETLNQLQHAPIPERIRIIEVILQSLKQDIKTASTGGIQHKPFKIQKFSLGKEVHVDRDTLYAERNM